MSSTPARKPVGYIIAAIAIIVAFVGIAAGKYLVSERYIDPYDDDVELTTLRWPNSEIAQLLPKPDSTRGYTYWESSRGFDIDVGDYTIEKFNEYVNECMMRGFTVDYHANPHSFSAYNIDGYDLYLYFYEDDGIMNVDISAPPEETSENESAIET